MQSFIQYRKFRRAAEAQIQRDQAKAQYHERRQDAPEENGSPTSTESDGDKIDLEKGEAASGNGIGQQLPPGVGVGDLPPVRHPELSRDESRRVEENQMSSEQQEAVEEKLREEDDEDADDFELGLNAHPTLSRLSTQQSLRTRLGTVLTGIEVRRRTTKEGGDGNVFVVGYEGDDDPNNPHNWSLVTRIRCTIIIAMIGCVVGFASAIDSAAIPQAAEEFGVSEIVETLATGLFLVGFGAGALFAGPISETVGRNPVYIATLVLYMVFVMASGLAPNIGAQLAFRFLAGLFGSTPLTCAGGSISDLWNPLERVYTFPVFANAAFTGPLLGPVMGGFIAQSSAVSWRWVEWSTYIRNSVLLSSRPMLIYVLSHSDAHLLRGCSYTGRSVSGKPLQASRQYLVQRLTLHSQRHFLPSCLNGKPRICERSQAMTGTGVLSRSAKNLWPFDYDERSIDLSF
jgi:hypothetical protein